MATPAQLPFVVAVGLEFGQADELARGQVRQAREIKSAQRQPQFTSGQQFATKPRPAIFRQGVSSQIFIGQIRGRLNGFTGDDGWLQPAAAEDSIEHNYQSSDDCAHQRVQQHFESKNPTVPRP